MLDLKKRLGVVKLPPNVDKFLYLVPYKSVIVNFDNAPGHNCPTIDAQIKASGRIILHTLATISMHLQSNDSYINSHIQYAINKVSCRETIQMLLKQPDERLKNFSLEMRCKIIEEAMETLTMRIINA